MIKSKSMAVAAAALAMCMAGSAFAQDGRYGRGPDQQQQQQQQWRQQGGPGYDRGADPRQAPNRGQPDYRNAYRGDYRSDHRADYRAHPGPYAYRGPGPQAEWRRGGRLPSEYRGRAYVIDDWRGHRLQQPQRGYQWVGVGGDFVLAAVATGLIAQIIAGQ